MPPDPRFSSVASRSVRYITGMKRLIPIAAALALHFATPVLSPARADTPVDLELVLAIDASGSVDEAEFALQRDGTAAAFLDPEIQNAIQSGPFGRIAVAIIVWAEAGIPGDESAWMLVETPDDANRLASMIAAFPRRVNGGTGIGAGLAQGMRMFERNGFRSLRQVVDVSGDGRETPPRDYVVLMPTARGMALSRGIVINGLAILNEDPDLLTWYRSNVTTGPDSFAVAATDYDDFQVAIRDKLLREIRYRPPLGQRPASMESDYAMVGADAQMRAAIAP